MIYNTPKKHFKHSITFSQSETSTKTKLGPTSYEPTVWHHRSAFTLASEVMVTSRILFIHSLSSSWLVADTSRIVRMLVFRTREKTYGLLPFPSGRGTENDILHSQRMQVLQLLTLNYIRLSIYQAEMILVNGHENNGCFPKMTLFHAATRWNHWVKFKKSFF